MDNPLVPSKSLTPTLLSIMTIIMIAVAFLGFFYIYRGNDPYIQSVLSLNGNVERGHEIFEINCAACHGVQADGSVGPSLQDVHKRKSKISLIEQVTSGRTPPMPKFQPNAQDMADLLSYLENL